MRLQTNVEFHFAFGVLHSKKLQGKRPYFTELSLLRLKLLFFDGDCMRYPSLLLPPFDRGFT